MASVKKNPRVTEDETDLAREGNLRVRVALKIRETGIAVVVSKSNDTMLMTHIKRLVHVPAGVYDPMVVMRKFLADEYLSRRPATPHVGEVAAPRERAPVRMRPTLCLAADPHMREAIRRAQLAEPSVKAMSSSVQYFARPLSADR